MYIKTKFYDPMKGVFINALLFSGSPKVFSVNKPENPFQTVMFVLMMSYWFHQEHKNHREKKQVQ